MRMGRLSLLVCSVTLAALILSGCSAPRVTETGRTAVEQFLISTVVDQAIKHADFSPFFGKKIFIEYDYLAPQVDKPYVQESLKCTWPATV